MYFSVAYVNILATDTATCPLGKKAYQNGAESLRQAYCTSSL